MAQSLTITGAVKTVFKGARPTWSAGVFKCDDGRTFKYVAKFMTSQGEQLQLTGEIVRHPKFGEQFKVKEAAARKAADPSGVATTIAAMPGLTGVGPVTARKIAEAAWSMTEEGEDLFETIIRDPQSVADVANLQVGIIETIARIASENHASVAETSGLCALGWTYAQAKRLFAAFGTAAVELTKKNPYLLVEAKGLGFATIDDIARKRMGIKRDDPRRMRAGVLYVIEQQEKSGNTCVSLADLEREGQRILRPDSLSERAMWMDAVDGAVEEQTITRIETPGAFYYGRTETIERERAVMEFISSGLREELEPLADADTGTLNEGQAAAVAAGSLFRVSVISGLAGCGKTYTMRVIADAAERSGLVVTLAAPTGKAARRLSQSTKRPASTLHSLLGARGEGVWTAESIDAGLLIVDEMSMVDVHLMHQLVKVLSPDTRVLLVGDHNQLPSIGAGSILRDVLGLFGDLPSVSVLDKVVRQSGILDVNSRAVLDEVFCWDSTEEWDPRMQRSPISAELVADVYDELVAKSEPSKVHVMSPMRQFALGSEAISNEIKERVQARRGNYLAPLAENKQHPICVGDRIMQWQNDHKRGLMNGEMMTVTAVHQDGKVDVHLDEGGREMTLSTEEQDQTRLAYATSVHKLQGSEVDHVILVLSTAHSRMLNRNLLYTAVTRAAKSVTFVANSFAVTSALDVSARDGRTTLGSILG